MLCIYSLLSRPPASRRAAAPLHVHSASHSIFSLWLFDYQHLASLDQNGTLSLTQLGSVAQQRRRGLRSSMCVWCLRHGFFGFRSASTVSLLGT